MTRSYSDLVARGKARWGSKFDDSDLAKKFVPFYENQKRIKIKPRWGGTETGTVGVTTGWRPAFILMRRSNALGSSTILSNRDEIIAVQVNGRYVEY